MNTSLNYMDLYNLTEELCQLRGGQLQEIVCESPDRYFLKFFLQSIGVQWVVLDLTPAQPFILSINSANPRKQKGPTPVLNFLKAHFKGLKLQSIEVAQKPNRTLKMSFGEQHTLTFRCFPHGQLLILSAEGKKVFYPLGQKQEEENVSFIEPEVKTSWDLNAQWARRFLIFPAKESTNAAASSAATQQAKQIAKLVKSLKAMEDKKDDFINQTQEKIRSLEKKAEEFKIEGQGKKLNITYDEIKKLKRRILEYGQKQNETQRRLHFLKTRGSLPEVANEEERAPSFAGTRILIDSQWQFWLGRKAVQNDELVKLASPHELWFHLRDYPSAHGILRGPKKAEAPSSVVDFCCLILAQLSQNKKRPFTEGEFIDFIVTPRKFVKKKKGSPAGTVYVERETVRRIAYRVVKFDVL